MLLAIDHLAVLRDGHVNASAALGVDRGLRAVFDLGKRDGSIRCHVRDFRGIGLRFPDQRL
jgi:hypothetical protein